MSNTKARNPSIDALKGIAIIAVILLHVPTSPAAESVYWQLLDIFGRFAVPCFFLISGYFFRLSWNRTKEKIEVFRKSAFRIIPIFLFWALFYATVPPFVGELKMPQRLEAISAYPLSFILNGNVYHLWFLSSLMQGLVILGIYLWIGRLYLGLAVGSILFTISLVISTYFVSSLGSSITFDMKSGPFFSTLFVLLGATLADGRYRLGNGIAIAATVFGFLICVAEVSFLHFFYGQPFRGTSLMFGIIPMALGLMNLSLNGCIQIPWLASIGRYSLGIYVIHPWFIEILKLPRFGILLDLPILIFFLALFLSFLITVLLAKIPYLRKLVL